MIMKKIFLGIGCGSLGLSLWSGEITPFMRSQAESAIARCENACEAVQVARKKLEPQKRRRCPLIKTKKNSTIVLRAFDRAFAALERQRQRKVKVQRATSSQKLQEEMSAYVTHCLQGAHALLGFVKWATQGSCGNVAKDKIYQESWFNQEKCGKYNCP